MHTLTCDDLYDGSVGLFPAPRDWFGVALGTVVGVGLDMAGVGAFGAGLLAGTAALLASNVSGGNGNM
jgi:hypothetical protein